MISDDLLVVVRYVEQHPGCSEVDIQKACPGVKNLGSLLQEASEGAESGEGYILEQRDGLFYAGPDVELGHQVRKPSRVK